MTDVVNIDSRPPFEERLQRHAERIRRNPEVKSELERQALLAIIEGDDGERARYLDLLERRNRAGLRVIDGTI